MREDKVRSIADKISREIVDAFSDYGLPEMSLMFAKGVDAEKACELLENLLSITWSEAGDEKDEIKKRFLYAKHDWICTILSVVRRRGINENELPNENIVYAVSNEFGICEEFDDKEKAFNRAKIIPGR